MKCHGALLSLLAITCVQAHEAGRAGYYAAHKKVLDAGERVVSDVINPANAKMAMIAKELALENEQGVLAAEHDHTAETQRFVRFILPLMRFVEATTKAVTGAAWRVTAGPSVAVDAVAIYYNAETGMSGVILGERPDRNGKASGKLAIPGGFVEVAAIEKMYPACGENCVAATGIKELEEEVHVVGTLIDGATPLVIYTPKRDIRQVLSICYGFLTSQLPQSSVELRNVRIVSFEELAELVKDSKNFAFDHGMILNKKLVQLAANTNLPESVRAKIARSFAPAK